MKNPIPFIPNVTVKLCPYKPFRRGEHIMIFRVTGAGCVEKTNASF
jgi:hypothetical protein